MNPFEQTGIRQGSYCWVLPLPGELSTQIELGQYIQHLYMPLYLENKMPIIKQNIKGQFVVVYATLDRSVKVVECTYVQFGPPEGWKCPHPHWTRSVLEAIDGTRERMILKSCDCCGKRERILVEKECEHEFDYQGKCWKCGKVEDD